MLNYIIFLIVNVVALAEIKSDVHKCSIKHIIINYLLHINNKLCSIHNTVNA